MAIKATSIGLVRTWELVSTALDTLNDVSDVAEGGIANFLGTIYVITSNVPNMTIEVQESPDNSNWVQITSEAITDNVAYRIAQPFPYLRIKITAHSNGQIDSIFMTGMVQ